MVAEITAALIGAGATLAAAVVPLAGARRKAREEGELVRQLEARVRELAELPKEVPADFAAEAAFIRGVRVFRRDYRMNLWFRPRPPDQLEIEAMVSFTVVNSTGADVRFAHSAEVVPETTGEDTRLLRASATGPDVADPYDNKYPTVGSPRLKHSQAATVRPNDQRSANRFEVRYRKTARRDGSEVLFLVQATLGAEVVIEEKPDDLDVAVEFSHRENAKVNVLPRGARQPSRWEFGKAFLPWQSIYIQWHGKGPTP